MVVFIVGLGVDVDGVPGRTALEVHRAKSYPATPPHVLVLNQALRPAGRLAAARAVRAVALEQCGTPCIYELCSWMQSNLSSA